MAMNFGEGYEGSRRKPMARPFGVALLIAGVDENGLNYSRLTHPELSSSGKPGPSEVVVTQR